MAAPCGAALVLLSHPAFRHVRIATREFRTVQLLRVWQAQQLKDCSTAKYEALDAFCTLAQITK